MFPLHTYEETEVQRGPVIALWSDSDVGFMARSSKGSLETLPHLLDLDLEEGKVMLKCSGRQRTRDSHHLCI